MHGNSVHINAIGLVRRLTEYAEQMHPDLARIPSQLFQQLLGVDDIGRVVADAERSIKGDPNQGRADFLIAALQACAHCAGAVKQPDGAGWSALLSAEQHAAVALAVHVASLEGAERLEALNRARAEANSRQTASATSTRTEPAKNTREFIVSRARELEGSKKAVAADLADELLEMDRVRYSQPSVNTIQNYISQAFPGDKAWEARFR